MGRPRKTETTWIRTPMEVRLRPAIAREAALCGLMARLHSSSIGRRRASIRQTGTAQYVLSNWSATCEGDLPARI